MIAVSALATLLAIVVIPGLLRAQQADRFAAVAPRMQEFVDKGEVAGVVTLIATKDRIIHLNAVGKTDLAKDRKMRTDDIFWIASMSKPITAVCIAILADDGKLSFDDPLAKYLPEFAGLMVSQNGQTAKPSRPVTLRNVMTHTSGIGEMTNREPHLTLAETSKRLSQQPLRFQPGSRWAYSTAGMDVLGRVVEVASGMPFDQFLQRRVLDPLGMKDTSFWIAPEKELRWAHPYRWNAQTNKLEETTISYLYKTAVTDRQRPPLGGAGLFSTAEDVARFYQMMLNQGSLNGKRILKPETVAEMTRKQTGALDARPGMPWGLGFCVVEDPAKMAANSVLSPNSFGHGGAFSTQSWADPAKNLIWIVMFERDGKGNPDNSDVRIAFQDAATGAETPIGVDTQNLLVSVDPAACRWSAEVKGTPMRLNDVHFLPGDDPSGWTVVSTVNRNDTNSLGSFVTVTLRGTKPGQLDFEYQISVSKTNNDILVSLGRSNNTGKAVDVVDMDYFVSDDARLGGSTERWTSLGAMSQNREYYDLAPVISFITPKMYEVNGVINDMDTGNSLLMGHVSNWKGASRFEVASGWQGKTSDRMKVRGYCSYKVTMPSGKSFAGEKLLIDFNTDALRAMEHQADLIAIVYDIRLKQRRPIDLNDRELVSNNYSRFHGYLSGGSEANADKFFKAHGLNDFYWGLGGPGRQGSFGLYGHGGDRQPPDAPSQNPGRRQPTAGAQRPAGAQSTLGGPGRTSYPDEGYLPIHARYYGMAMGTRVIDFSNPLTIKLERERAFQWVVGHENETGRAEMDFADWWDKWPGQYDPYMSALETYRAAGTPWREVIDQKAPRRVIRSNMNVVDHSYGIVDICRVSDDADHGYEMGDGWRHWLTDSLLGSSIRAFYNGRVFWNDGDGFHVYKSQPIDESGGRFNYGQAKVSSNFHAMAGSTLFLEEAFNEPYPEDRIELLKRISPPTPDVSYPVDLFIRKPAQIWNMPVERPFGKWNVLSVFNYTSKTPIEWVTYTTTGTRQEELKFTAELDAAKDLRLDPDKEYIVYEFWSKKLIGTFKGTFVTRPLNPYDCDIYSIVEKQDRPVLISTSRHIRQMAFDIKDLAYDGQQRVLRGVSRAVAGDPYQLRIYVPDGFTAKRVELSGGLTAKMATDEHLLMVDYTTSTGNDVEWKVFF